MEREELNQLYELLDDFYITYDIGEKKCEMIEQIQEEIMQYLKVSEKWNLVKN